MTGEWLNDLASVLLPWVLPWLLASLAIYFCLRLVNQLPGLSASLRYRLWVAGLAAMVLVPFGFWLGSSASEAGITPGPINAEAAIAEPIYPDPVPVRLHKLDAVEPLTSTQTATPVALENKSSFQALQLPGWAGTSFLVLWLAGGLAGAMLTLLALIQLARVRQGLQPVDSGVRHLFSDLLGRFSPGRSILLGEGPVDRPLALGFRPAWVALPQDLHHTLPTEELQAVLSHEIAHLKRRDDWQLLFCRGLAILAWPNPLVHLAQKEVSRCRELACDELALEYMQNRGTYARTLTRLSALGQGFQDLPAPALWSRSPNLKRRIAMILKPEKTTPWASRLALFALALFLGLSLWSSQKAQAWVALQDVPAPEPAPAVPAPNPDYAAPAPAAPAPPAVAAVPAPKTAPQPPAPISPSSEPVLAPAAPAPVHMAMLADSGSTEKMSKEEREKFEREMAEHARQMEKHAAQMEAEMKAKLEAMAKELKALEGDEAVRIQEDAMRAAEESLRQVEDTVMPLLQNLLSETLPTTLEGVLGDLLSEEDMTELRTELRDEIRAGLEEARRELAEVRETLPEELERELAQARRDIEKAKEELRRELERIEKEKAEKGPA